MKTASKIFVRTLGIILGTVLCFQLIEAALVPWDGFKIQSKPIIGEGNQYE